MIDVRMGQEDEIDLVWSNRPSLDGNGRIATLDHPAIDKNIQSPNLHQPTGSGHTLLPSQMLYFHRIHSVRQADCADK
jgi:hypothetical protein